MSASTLPSSGIAHVPLSHAPSRVKMSRRTRAAVYLTLAFWGSNYVLLTLGTALSANEHLAAIAAMRILTTFLGLGFCYLIHLLLTHPRISTTKRRLIALALVAPVSAETFAWAAFFAEAAVDPSQSLQNFTWYGAVRTISFWTWFFLAWAGLYLALMYSFDVQEEQRRTAELREKAHAAQLQALHAQINPHFLFNSLNSVSALILDRENDLADEMVVKLASFLRLGLAADPTAKVPLAVEMQLQRAYLDIERLRYADLIISIEIPERLETALVPSLILQPIVENAIKHGVSGAPPPAFVEISASEADGRLVLAVTDSGQGKCTSKGAGIGLSNVRQRLELLYGVGASLLSAGRDQRGRFHVQLHMPLEFL